MEPKYEILSRYFGYTSFRGGQEALIDSLLDRRDALGIMPTGGGKSLCYQLPALLMEGITLVVSPLISLMKDQVMSLKNAGIAAAFINSSLTASQIRLVYRRMLEGWYKIVYIAPERLMTEEFLRIVQQLSVAMVVVDEAHCISQWGQDFRPSYLRIAEFLQQLPRRPVVSAFTATATELVRQDILRSLALQDPTCVITGFDRPNLYFDVLRPKDKDAALLELLLRRPGKSGIVYCSTRQDVEDVCQTLSQSGFSATRYHAGLSDEERRSNQDDFVFDRKSIMVATNAFGMGIDKSNVSFVIHYNMPKSIEAYYQEVGRAGRDGADADCILLFSPSDVTTARFLIEHSGDNSDGDPELRQTIMAQDYLRLEAMVDYCKTQSCLRGYLLAYFGETHPENCGSCGNCRGQFLRKDITTQAKMILSCVQRIQDRLGYALGTASVIRVLRGSRSKRIRELGLEQLSTYGLMAGVSNQELHRMIDCLETEKYLRQDPVHRALVLTQKSGEILFGNATVQMSVRLSENRPKSADVPAAGNDGSVDTSAAGPDEALYTALKKLRFRIARQENVPAYIVFSNATLMDMAAKQPRNPAAFLQVSGVGRMKAERYGEAFLEEIRRWAEEEGSHG